jgi:hypothetical protein
MFCPEALKLECSPRIERVCISFTGFVGVTSGRLGILAGLNYGDRRSRKFCDPQREMGV